MFLENEFKEVFKLDDNWRPLEYIENDFEERGAVVRDLTTGIMWQNAGSEDGVSYGEAREYVMRLNQECFAGYVDWRLPTLDELASLLMPEKQSNDLYIDPIFDSKQRWCWTSDRHSGDGAWYVDFIDGYVNWSYRSLVVHVRVCRS